MISIQSSLSELERSHQLRTAVLDAYILAIQNIAHYPVELDEELTVPTGSIWRPWPAKSAPAVRRCCWTAARPSGDCCATTGTRPLSILATCATNWPEPRAAWKKCWIRWVKPMATTKRSLRTALGKLRQVAATPGYEALGSVVSAAADSIENSLEQVRKQHQLTTSQFLVEIRMLHKRIDALESAVSVDEVTRLATREEFTERIGSTPGGAVLPPAGGRPGAAPGGGPIRHRGRCGALRRFCQTAAQQPAALRGHWPLGSRGVRGHSHREKV